MPLTFDIGQSSLTGPRERNEDYVGIVTPAGEQLSTKGALIAVADGVSGNAGGGEAAEMTVRTISADYYATPDTWQPHLALNQVLLAANRWVLSQANANRDMAGMATTLSLLVLRGQRYYSAHVGDTRIYLLRDGVLKQLTADHVWDRPDMRHVLKRAIGLDAHLTADFGEGNLQEGDIFALLSDGVWDSAGEQAIHKGLTAFHSAKMVAEHLTETAIKKGSTDNSTAVIVKITAIGDETLFDLMAGGKQLKLPNKLTVGEVIDDFEVVEILHESRASLLYKVKNTITNQLFVLKTLQPLLANDLESCNALLNEEWLSKRVVSQYVPQILPLSTEKRSKLYYVMSWHEGATLQQQLDSGHHFTAVGVAKIGIELLRGLGALHRLSIIHRDIKPANIHMASDQRLRILDLGVAYSKTTNKNSNKNNSNKNISKAKLEQEIDHTNNNPGTPSFMAPELFDGAQANEQSDIYAAGVSLYLLLSRKYPHGEIEPFQHPKFAEPSPITRYRPDIPAWLDNVIQKAISRDLAKRFETAEEMLLALEIGELKPLQAQRTPLIARARLLKWQWIAIFSIVINILLVYLLVVS